MRVYRPLIVRVPICAPPPPPSRDVTLRHVTIPEELVMVS